MKILYLFLLLCLCAFASANLSKISTVSAAYDEALNVIYFNGMVFVPQNGDFERPLNLVETEINENPIPAEELPGEAAEGERFAVGTPQFYYCLIVAICLTLGAGVFSGLTVGYLSIDQLELEMKLYNGTDEEKKNALAVLPVLEDHHYLLVTLLLANALCMEALPIYLDSIVPSAYAILISVVAVLFFGEVIPQAVCTGPQQIRIGAALAPFIHLLKIVLGIVSYPIAKVLDCTLGQHISTRYTNNDLKALIELHSYHALEAIDQMHHYTDNDDHGLNPYQMKMINSVIDFKQGSVKKLMIPPTQIFSLNVNKKVDNAIAKKITKAGYSRIPVYEKNDKNRIIGIMLIKTLIGLELGEGKKICELVNEGEVTLRKPLFISPNEKFETLLQQFLKGKSHMAIVTDDVDKMEDYIKGLEDNAGEISLLEHDVIDSENGNVMRLKKEPATILGLLTLEDLIEYIIKEDILDEGDYDNDLERNRNPNVRADRNFGTSSNNISKFMIENRDKVKEIVHNQLSTNIDKRNRFKFRKDYAQSIVLPTNKEDMLTPLIDKDKQEDS